jgi:hypothetical protein
MLLSSLTHRPRHSALRILALLAVSAATGCLEANAAQTDSGAAADVHAGTDAASPHADAKTDATTPGTDATMPGAPESGPVADGSAQGCKAPTTAFTMCASCDETSCTADLSAAVSACPAFYACFAECDCTDTSCADACAVGNSSTCTSALTTLGGCQSAMCATECAAPASDAGPHPDGAAQGCKNPTPTFTGCASCDETSCAADLSAAQSACPAFYSCFASCNCTDMSCADTCAAGDSTACTSALTTLDDCQTSMCAYACSTTSTDGGGSAPMVPDCADPTTEEASIYAACSSCDATSCQSDVTTAVSACGAYYTCFAACDCDNVACEDACEADLNTACDTAIGALTTCQDTSCATPCSGE